VVVVDLKIQKVVGSAQGVMIQVLIRTLPPSGNSSTLYAIALRFFFISVTPGGV
jgi:hypothetical protein